MILDGIKTRQLNILQQFAIRNMNSIKHCALLYLHIYVENKHQTRKKSFVSNLLCKFLYELTKTENLITIFCS